MNVFELFATLGLDTSQYDSALSSAESSANSFGSALSSGLGTAARVGAAAVAATTTAVVAGSAAFVNGVSDVAAYADNIDKMSQKLGMSAEAYQEWDFIMQHAGTSIESMQASMKTLASAAENGNEAFAQLGMTQEQIASMSQEELFGATIEALQSVEDTTERTYLAGQLLGRGATELGALLNMSADEVANMRQEVHDLGGIMSDEAVSAGATFQDSLQNVQTALGGVRNSLLSDFLPSFSTVMDGLSAIFSGDEGGIELVRQGVSDFADQMNETLPTFLEIGGEILSVLSDALIENLPTLISIGSDVISRLGSGLISNAPLLISSALEIIMRITEGLIEAAPELLSASLEIITMLGNYLIENLPELMGTTSEIIMQLILMLTDPANLEMMISMSLQLILAIADGLVQAIPNLVSVIPQVIGNLIIALTDSFPQILETVGLLLGDLALMVLGLVGGLMGSSYDEVMGNLEIIWDEVGQSLTDFAVGLGTWISDIVTGIGDMWNDIVAFFGDGIMNVGDALSGWWDELVSWFNNLIDSAVAWGSDMIDSFIDGITSGVSNIGSAMSGFAETVASYIHFSEPDVGPLSDFSTYAPDMVQTFARGIDESIPVLSDSLNNMSAYVADNMPSMDSVYNGSVSNIGVATSADGSSLPPIVVQAYFGNEKFDEYVVDSNQRNDYISGGRA